MRAARHGTDMAPYARPDSPTPAQIKAAREVAGDTQQEAAETVHAAMRTWQDWEAGIADMHPGLWELYLIKAEVIV